MSSGNPPFPPSNGGAKLGNRFSLAVVMYHQAVAERAGLNITDHKCLGLILEEEEMTPGRMASLAGLTSGAATTVIDRLERAGFVRRSPDPRDRRKTILRADRAKVEAEIAPLMASFRAAMGRLFAGYSEQEVLMLVDFLTRCADVFREEARKLREGGNGSSG